MVDVHAIAFNPSHADECRQVHAEASTFATGISKGQAYAQVLEQARALFDGQRNWVRSAITVSCHCDRFF